MALNFLEDVLGDFEDLETGEVHKATGDGNQDSAEIDKEDGTENEKSTKAERLEKKKQLKEMFNTEYDDKEGDTSYYDDVKAELNVQSQVSIFSIFIVIVIKNASEKHRWT